MLSLRVGLLSVLAYAAQQVVHVDFVSRQFLEAMAKMLRIPGFKNSVPNAW